MVVISSGPIRVLTIDTSTFEKAVRDYLSELRDWGHDPSTRSGLQHTKIEKARSWLEETLNRMSQEAESNLRR
jgi:hypothetical protein